MDGLKYGPDLEKYTIKQLKVLCSNYGVNFKSKWRKKDYIFELDKHLREISANKSPESENELSLGLNCRSVTLDIKQEDQLENVCKNCLQSLCICQRLITSTPLVAKRHKKGNLTLNTQCHKWFQDICGQDAPQPDEVQNWKLNPHPTTIPKIIALEVFQYLVKQKNIIDNVSNKHMKGFNKAVAHDAASDIIGGIETSIVYNQFLYIKSRCYPSMKTESYRVVVVLDSLDRFICGGACECPIGKSGACSHIGALLLFLEQYADLGDEDYVVACTSELCKWKGPKTRKFTAKPLTEISFNRPRLYSKKLIVTIGKEEEVKEYARYDPRHPDDRNTDVKKIKTAIKELKKIYPNTGAAHFWDLTDDEDDVLASDPPSISFEIDSSATIDVEEESMMTVATNLIYKPTLIYQDIEESDRDAFASSQTTTPTVASFIESQTKDQSSNQLWKELKSGRITSSMFGQVLRCQEKKFPVSLVDSILNPCKLDKYSRLPPAILRGRNLEPVARKAYEDKFNVTVEPSGLSLLLDYAFIGASGDGIISDPSMLTKGVLEIKCPCSVKGTDISNTSIQTIADNFPSFCLKKDRVSGEIHLDRKSNYYSQVQGEMAVKQLSWADFVVFTEAPDGGLFPERILFDDEFWNTKLLPKLIYFFSKYISPFLIKSI